MEKQKDSSAENILAVNLSTSLPETKKKYFMSLNLLDNNKAAHPTIKEQDESSLTRSSPIDIPIPSKDDLGNLQSMTIGENFIPPHLLINASDFSVDQRRRNTNGI